MKQHCIIIGGGIGGLAAACLLGKAGYRVTVLEKNSQLGGRAGQLKAKGFTFDTGPSWYLMPEVFEHFFSLMDERVEDHLRLIKLSPSYRVHYTGEQKTLDITSDPTLDAATFDAVEPGAGERLKAYLHRSSRMYHIAATRFLYKNYDGFRDSIAPDLAIEIARNKLHTNAARYIKRYFSDPKLQKIAAYPLMFLGNRPGASPAIYTMLSHTDMVQGVHYPLGGMYELVKALLALGKKYDVVYKTNAAVEQILVTSGAAIGVRANGKDLAADIIISNADMHHTETNLLAPMHRDHSDRFWRTRRPAPSALLLFLGLDRTYKSLAHHNLLFARDWRRNMTQLFSAPGLPDDPSLYVCAPSKTDPNVAPTGHENIFVLVPVGAGVTYTPDTLNTYTTFILETLEKELRLTDLRQHIVYQKQTCADDFAAQFNSFKGSALGLAHTLTQSASLRPRNTSRKVRNLYYVGAGVHPGIGIPPALISAELLYKRFIGETTARPLSSLHATPNGKT